MTANYTDTGIDAEIHDTATLASLIWLRERVQSHIDALTPTLPETQQTGPVQVVESESEAWSKDYVAKDGDGPFIPDGYSLMHGMLVEDLPKETTND